MAGRLRGLRMCTLVRMMEAPSADDRRSMTERMRAGDLYIADDPEIFEAANASIDLMGAYNATTPRQEQLRRQLLSRSWARSVTAPRSGRPCTLTTAATCASAPAVSPTSA